MSLVTDSILAKERRITDYMLMEYLDFWKELDITKNNDARMDRYYYLLLNLIEHQVEAGIRWLDSEEAKEYFFGEAEFQHDSFKALEDEWDEILSQKYPSIQALLDEVYRRGKGKGYLNMGERLRLTPSDIEAFNIALNYNYYLIRNIDSDVRSNIKNKIVAGVIAGDNPNVIAPKILNIANEQLEGSNFTPKQRATMIAKTEVSRIQNTGMLQSYINEGYTEVKLLTAEDDHVCATCLEYAYEFNKDDEIIFTNRGEEKVHNIIKLVKGGKFPPFHPLCRCTYLTVWESKTRPPEDPYIIDLTPDGWN